MELDAILLAIEVLGVISFAISGSIIAIDKEMDIIGVYFLALCTAFGGGILRDVMIGNIPPLFFGELVYLVVIAALTATLVFLFACLFKRWYLEKEALIINVNNYIDAIGLGSFAVSGAKICLAVCPDGGAFLAVAMGVVSAVGGGMIRDVCLGDIPFVLRKRVYALAAIIGATLYYLIDVVIVGGVVGDIVGSAVGILTVVLIRVLATRFKWNLPKVKLSIKDGGDKY